MLETNDATCNKALADYPLEVNVTKELLVHNNALLWLFHSEEPLAILLRPASKSQLRYHIGDASAEGFGSAIQYPNLLVDG